MSAPRRQPRVKPGPVAKTPDSEPVAVAETGRPNDFDSPALIRLAVIRPADDNLRGDLGDLTSLRSAIRAQGVLQPLLVAPLAPVLVEDATGIGCTESDTSPCGHCIACRSIPAYVVVDGHRRFAAAVAEGLDVVPALVRRMSDADRVEAMLSTALEKRDLLPSEEAEGYRRLAELGKSQRQIADMFGVNQSHVSKTLALAKLPDQAKRAVDSGGITRELAVKVAGLPEGTQRKLYNGNRLPTDYEINTAIRDQELSERRSAAESKARAAGLRVLRREDVHWTMSAGDAKGMWLSGLAQPPRETEHAPMPCHAVAWNGRVMSPVCTDPGTHRAKAEPRKKAAPPKGETRQEKINREATEAAYAARRREQEERTQRQALAKVDADRRQAMHMQLVATPKTPDVLALAAHMIPWLQNSVSLMTDARELLEAAEVATFEEPDGWRGPCDHLAEFAGDDTRHQAQVLYAMALVEGETHACEPDDDWEAPLTARYFAHLVAHGYELSDLERSWLPQAEPSRAVDGDDLDGPLDGDDLDGPLTAEFIAEVQAKRDAPCGQCGGPRDSAAIRHGHPTCGTCDRDRIAEQQMEAELAKPPENVEGISDPAAEPEFEGDLIDGTEPGTTTWRCSCSVEPYIDYPTEDEAAADLDTHMIAVHGYEPVEADA